MKCSAIAPNFIFSSNPNHLIMSKLEFITEGMLFKIRQHQQELPEALRRAALADYREGVFSITINTRDRCPYLGFIRVSSDEELAITKKNRQPDPTADFLIYFDANS